MRLVDKGPSGLQHSLWLCSRSRRALQALPPMLCDAKHHALAWAALPPPPRPALPQRALFDGFAMSFLTQLDPSCAPRLEKLMQTHLVGSGTSLKVRAGGREGRGEGQTGLQAGPAFQCCISRVMHPAAWLGRLLHASKLASLSAPSNCCLAMLAPTSQTLMRAPPQPPGPGHVLFDHFWVETGGGQLPEGRESDGGGGAFVLTPAVKGHLRNLARAVLLRRYPILLQVGLWAGGRARGRVEESMPCAGGVWGSSVVNAFPSAGADSGTGARANAWCFLGTSPAKPCEEVCLRGARIGAAPTPLLPPATLPLCRAPPPAARPPWWPTWRRRRGTPLCASTTTSRQTCR